MKKVPLLVPGAALAALGLFLASSCATVPERVGGSEIVIVNESWVVDDFRKDNIDSVAVWPGEGWLVATAKSTDKLLVHDTRTGALVREILLEAPEAFRRPNGIAVFGDRLVVVERDHHRVSVLALPGLELIGTFGEQVLVKPYGLSIVDLGEGRARIYVTDDFDLVPGGPGLDERIKVFEAAFHDDRVHAELASTFGDLEGGGVLHVVESIAADASTGKLVVADELEEQTYLKLFDLEGRYLGETVGEGLFTAQAEGIALRPCGKGGYWITTDQHPRTTVFLLFERESFAFAGAFRGPKIANTDGITVVANPLPGFPGGALFAVHDDRGVGAFDWNAIASALDLNCPSME